ncbi:MAG: histidine ammonia-lyase [Leptolyngbya sp. PLA1]|nr:histidine ammonia-lyase [Leptolyngbya sp. PLA1]
MTTPLTLDGSPLTIQDVLQVARQDRRVQLAPVAVAAMTRARGVVEAAMADGLPHYGINTGFGSLSRQRIGEADLRTLQQNLLRSHSAGVGDPLPRDVVRGMMVLLAASLARGCSGVRPVVVEGLLGLLNAGVTPRVPSTGSVGASGDLAPLAALGLVLSGEGRARVGGGPEVPGAEALRVSGLTPLPLEAKEGLAIINGTHLMASRGALLCADADRLFKAAMMAAAMSVDACRGTDSYLDARVHEVRKQPGQARVASELRGYLAGSQIVPSHAENDPRVQDPYSLRCVPQVLGAALDCLEYVKQSIGRELGAVTDNPLVLGGDVISAGNFHGMPLAIPLDALSIAISHVAGIAERRVFWMTSAFDPESHLRPYLTPDPGLCSGLMIAQYTAAACCNELVGLATPASVANVPTSAEIEDYNSFGPRAAAKAARGLELAEYVVAIELLCAAAGLDVHRPLRSGARVERAHALVRSVAPPLTADRELTPDIEAIAGLIRRGELEAC